VTSMGNRGLLGVPGFYCYTQDMTMIFSLEVAVVTAIATVATTMPVLHQN